MKCFYCNQRIPDGSDICPGCGRHQRIDQDLIDAAKRGDENAMTELYNRTSNAVYNTVKFQIKDEDASMDIMQDTYFKAFGSLDQLQDASSFPAWIKRIACNKAIDYRRKRQPLYFSDLADSETGDEPEFEDSRPENLPETVIDRRETARLIGEILDSLPDDQRICITMRYYDQLSVKEIAEELNVPEATVKSRLQYGRRKIETKVRDLEKKGTKLYGFAPIPFLLLLFRTAEENPADEALLLRRPEIIWESAAGLKAAAGTASKAAGSAGSIAGTASKAAGSAGSIAGAAGASATTKIITAVLAVSLIGGGGFAVSKVIQRTPQEPVPAVQPAPELPVPPEEPPVPPETEEVNEEPPVPDELEGTAEDQPEGAEDTADEDNIDSDEQPADPDVYNPVFEQIRAGYEDCMSGFADADSPFLQYPEVQWTVENKAEVGGVTYALYDINKDGTPEMIMGYPEFYIEDSDTNYTVFEIYAFDRDHAVPLTPYFETEYDYINIYQDGTIRTHIGNGGDPNEEVYLIPPFASYLDHTGTASIYDDYRPDSAEIHFSSILKAIN